MIQGWSIRQMDFESIGFTRSTVDECIFYRGTTIFIAYVDDALAFDMNGDVLDSLLQELRDTGLRLDDMGHPSDYIGVNSKQRRNGKAAATQHLCYNMYIPIMCVYMYLTPPYHHLPHPTPTHKQPCNNLSG
jgi:hypothetical protein